MNVSFENKVVMITGAARGQGRLHAKRFAELGAKLILCDICENVKTIPYALGNYEDFMALCAELAQITDNQIIANSCDVRDIEGITELVKLGKNMFGKIDILINNAGVCSIRSPWDISEQDWNDMIGINLTGTWNCCRAVIPIMKNQQRGRIINIGSIAGIKGIPNLSHYVASKHGVVGLTKGLAIDLAPYNITVNCICPGSVDTELLEGLAPVINHTVEEAKAAFANYHLTPSLIPPEHISDLILWLSSDYSDSVTGAVWNIDKGWLQN